MNDVRQLRNALIYFLTWMCDGRWEHYANINSFRFIRSKSAATGTILIERASKTDLMRILAVYQHKHSDTNNNK